jgi:hypothetical protein
MTPRDRPGNPGRFRPSRSPIRRNSAGLREAMRSASGSEAPRSSTALCTAWLMSSAAPASVPSARCRRPSRSLIASPYSSNPCFFPPTGGIASVTSIGRPAPLSARRSIAGWTWKPSAI